MRAHRVGWLLGLVAAALAFGSARGGPPLPSPQSAVAGKPVLRVDGRAFRDALGRVVLMRGVNVSGGAKVPPFFPVRSTDDLAPLPGLGFNAVRLVFIWEAFEPSPGVYDGAYLAAVRQVADGAWARGLYVIVDFHQDGFSRFASRGSGDGFPCWALSRRATPALPDNGPGCKNWAVLMASDLNMHRSFYDFYENAAGVRSHYLAMLRRASAGLASCPGVVGYDLLNEPWGREREQLGPLYRDGAAAVRQADPTAIVFVEGHVSTNTGLQTKLDRPGFDNFAYAPHFYDPLTILRNGWRGGTRTIARGFANMEAKAAEWGVPLFVGEFGVPPGANGSFAYASELYDRLDGVLASGAQWNYTPTWNDRDKDGWNAEDFHILGPDGRPRANFPNRPYPRAVAGTPLRFAFAAAEGPGRAHELELVWRHDPALGATEVYLPSRWFPEGGTVVAIEAEGGAWSRDLSSQTLRLTAARPGTVRARVAGTALR